MVNGLRPTRSSSKKTVKSPGNGDHGDIHVISQRRLSVDPCSSMKKVGIQKVIPQELIRGSPQMIQVWAVRRRSSGENKSRTVAWEAWVAASRPTAQGWILPAPRR